MKKLNLKKEAIINSAIELFSKDGFHNTKVVDISNHAKVGKGTIYEYFKNKEELYMESIKYVFELYETHLKEAIDEEKSPLEKLKKYLYISDELTKKYGSIVFALMKDIRSNGMSMFDTLIEYENKDSQLVMEIFQDGMNENIFKDICPMIATNAFIGSIRFHMSNKYIRPKGHIEENDLEYLFNMLLYGIVNE
ncbi:MAG: TetR/AcrR family transcriptional regulator [Anaeromicrobium sp.]|jgi:TetR/AcrR family fatty acid metabolism transcriptional regulator|uniref:TetR/AcrR family transcriptional regulator n=1 Tax=Anaeromicrobium sp. TaxID=1929132 RepID=UPI0025F67E93|nr:TetR/AcrR family transcriptional regulator [Anaeromicrobium sp.]MCT4593008.1 TetR/AcrR family transcriptional regulator [Anaeromicrobium sp.]